MEILSESDTEVTLRLNGSYAAATGVVRIEANNGGIIITSTSNFTIVGSSTITSVTPTSGHGGTYVTVTGHNLRGNSSAVVDAFLGDVSALSVVSESDDEVVFRAGASPAIDGVDVVVVAASNATATLEGNWTYVDPGRVFVVEPETGQADTLVTISGLSLCGGGTEITNVTFAGAQAEIVSQRDCVLLVARAPDLGANTSTPITLESDTGALVTSVSVFLFVAEGEITAVTPPAGQGGTEITITGRSLYGGGTSLSLVTLGGVPATVTSANANATRVVVLANAGPLSGNPNIGDVVILGNTGVSVRSVGGWTYSTIDTISPTSGQLGTRVTLTGVRLQAGGSSVVDGRIGSIAVLRVVRVPCLHHNAQTT